MFHIQITQIHSIRTHRRVAEIPDVTQIRVHLRLKHHMMKGSEIWVKVGTHTYVHTQCIHTHTCKHNLTGRRSLKYPVRWLCCVIQNLFCLTAEILVPFILSLLIWTIVFYLLSQVSLLPTVTKCVTCKPFQNVWTYGFIILWSSAMASNTIYVIVALCC